MLDFLPHLNHFMPIFLYIPENFGKLLVFRLFKRGMKIKHLPEIVWQGGNQDVKMTSIDIIPLTLNRLRKTTGSLNHFRLMLHFYTTRKRQETKGFLAFSGGIEMEYFHEMRQVNFLFLTLGMYLTAGKQWLFIAEVSENPRNLYFICKKHEAWSESILASKIF